MNRGKATQSTSVIPFLLNKGNLKVGDPLGCIHKGELHRGIYKKKESKEKKNGSSVFIVGIATKEGILCGCCLEVLPMSVFEQHAGSTEKRGSKIIFLMNGSFKSLRNLINEEEESSAGGQGGGSAVGEDGGEDREAESSSQSKRRRTLQQNCDFCLLMGVEVICCANPTCPAIFHRQCSGMQDSSNGKWYCQKCTCRLCVSLRVLNTNTNDREPPKVTYCALCGEGYHTNCIGEIGKLQLDENAAWFCSGFCEKASEMIEGRVKETLNAINPYPLTLVRWTGRYCAFLSQNPTQEEKSDNLEKLQQKAAEVEKLFHGSFLLKNSFKYELFENILYPVNPYEKLGQNVDFRCLDEYGFYAVLLEEEGKVITVATIRIHSSQVAEMPFITTSEAHRGEGFCYKFMEHLQEMLKIFGVQTLVVQSPPESVAMWASKFSLRPTDADAMGSLLRCNLLKREGTILLCKRI